MTQPLSILYLVVIGCLDLKTRRIPNKVILFVSALALTTNGWLGGLEGVLASLLGFLLGGILLLVPFLLGGMGGGDVKAMAALGALIGPPAIFQTFLYTALIGGGFALLFCLFTPELRVGARTALGTFVLTRDARSLAPAEKKKHKFPYAPAMALGYCAWLLWGNLV